MTKIAHIFELDNVLWKIDRGIWIINKDDPTKPLLKISESDFALIESGIYKSQGFKINFSGKTYWLPKSLNERLRKTVKRYDANMHKLGISLQEYLNEDVIEHLKFDLKLENIEHLKNVTEDIYIVTSKTTKDKYKKMVRKLENKLEEEGLRIKGFFYINETFYNQRDDDNSYKKTLILLRFLSGQKIVKDAFTAEQVDKYDEVHFYDSSVSSIESAKNVQKTLDKLYINTDDNQSKRILRERVDSIDLKLKVVQVTTNKMNPFIESEFILKGPRQVMRFESFLSDNTQKINEAQQRIYGVSNYFSEGHRPPNLPNNYFMVDVDGLYTDGNKIVAILEDKYTFKGVRLKSNPLDETNWQRKGLLNFCNDLKSYLILNEESTDSWYYVKPDNKTSLVASDKVKTNLDRYTKVKTENSIYLELRYGKPTAIMYMKDRIDSNIVDMIKKQTTLRVFEVNLDVDITDLPTQFTGFDDSYEINSDSYLTVKELSTSITKVIREDSDWLKVYKEFKL